MFILGKGLSDKCSPQYFTKPFRSFIVWNLFCVHNLQMAKGIIQVLCHIKQAKANTLLTSVLKITSKEN